MALEIRLVKLVNGDMVIGKWDLEKRLIKAPAVLQTVPTEQGGMQMMLLPFGYPFDTEIDGEISMDHIMYEYKSIPAELETKYLEATSSLTISSANDLRTLENLGRAGGNGSRISELLRK